jgi:GT2 family glycosyltransferase
MRSRVDLAVVIVSMNDAEWLPPCLASLEAHAGDLSLEVVVVENGEAGPTERLLREEFPAVRFLGSPNLGFAHGNNVGLRTCHARHVLFLNPDTELVDGSLADLVRALDRRPRTGAAGVRQLTGDGRLYPTIRRFPNALRSLANALGVERTRLPFGWAGERVLSPGAYSREGECDWTVGAFLLVRGEALESAGAMDERFFLYSEETDLCLRIKSAGWEVRHMPLLTIIHHAGKGGVDPALEAQNAYARMQHARKHFAPVHRELYRATVILGFAIRWLRARRRGDATGRRACSMAIAAARISGTSPFRPPPPVAIPATDSLPEPLTPAGVA